MTPTQIEVTEEQYNSGSSALCYCGVINYFLVPLVDVSHQWNCCVCGEDNFHPCHQQSRDKVKEMRVQLEQMRKSMELSLVTSEDEPKYNHQFTGRFKMNALDTLRQLTEESWRAKNAIHIQIEYKGVKTEYRGIYTEHDICFVSWEPFKVYDHYSQIPGVTDGASIVNLSEEK